MQTALERYGLAVRNAREKRNMSQQDLAQRLSMNKNTIMDIELGRSNPKGETMFLIAAELRISMGACVFTDGWLPNAVTAEVLDFFSAKDEAASHQYIEFCHCIEDFSKDLIAAETE